MNKNFNLLLFAATIMFPVVSKAQTIKGRIIDELSQPIPFANIVMLSLNDSAFVQGTISNGDGNFSIETDKKEGILKIIAVR